MNDSVGSTIEKIKLQEKDIENKLKEKREHEAALSTINLAIKDAIAQVAKSDQQRLEIYDRIQKLQPLLEIGRVKRRALLSQLATYTKTYEDLKIQCNRGISNVWSLRSTLCDRVQSVSEDCDIWALLMRPVCTDSLPQPQLQEDNNKKDAKLIDNENRLKNALQRRKDIEVKRDKLLVEPDTGEEFVRIKNALHYSLQKITNLRN